MNMFKYPYFLWFLVFVHIIKSLYYDLSMWDKIMLPGTLLMLPYYFTLFIIGLLHLSINKRTVKNYSVYKLLMIPYFITILFIVVAILEPIIYSIPHISHGLIRNFYNLLYYVFVCSNTLLLIYWATLIIKERSSH